MAKRYLKGFLYAVGIDASEYPLTSQLKTSFIDGSKKPITDVFNPYDCILKEDSIKAFVEFINSTEKKLSNGESINIDSIQIATYSITVNPFTPHLQLFMRDV